MDNNFYLGLNAELIDKKLADNFLGVGLIRSEYLCRNINEYITTLKCQKYIEKYITNICKMFENKKVWYRFTDLTGNEIATLNGADNIEIEKYHFIGTKGARRYLKYKQTFKTEIRTIAKVYKNNKNLGVIIPYIKDIEEFKEIKKIIRENGYNGGIGIMAEIPSVLFQIDEFISAGVDNITVGLNDLTSLLLGTYRESEYHNKLSPIIIKIVKSIQEKCKKENVEFFIAGYFKRNEIIFYKKIGIDKIIINYANLPEINDEYHKLKDLNLLQQIKESTKSARNVIETKKEAE